MVEKIYREWYNDCMNGKSKKTRARKAIDLAIYCVAVVLLFFAVILVLQEFVYIPQDVYTDPPPARPAQSNPSARVTYAPQKSVSPEATPTEQGRLPGIQSPAITETPDAAPTKETPPSTPAPTFDMSKLHPVKLYFIEQKVSCDILPVALTANNQMGTIRSAHDVGWLFVEPYVLPGDMGKSIIAGHNRWNGKNGTFSVLKKLEAGDSIAVEMSDSYARYFTVERVYECSYDDNSMMNAQTDRAELVLITCKGDWSSTLHTSLTRVVAICVPTP